MTDDTRAEKLLTLLMIIRNNAGKPTPYNEEGVVKEVFDLLGVHPYKKE